MSSKIQNRAAFTMAAFLFTIAALLLTACGGGGGGGGSSLSLNSAADNAVRGDTARREDVVDKADVAADTFPRSGSATQSPERTANNVEQDRIGVTVTRASSGVNYTIGNRSSSHGWTVTYQGRDYATAVPRWRGVPITRQVTVNGTRGTLAIDAYSDHQGGNDTDYLAGGLWLFIPEDASNTNDLQVGAFADGSDLFNQDHITALTGNATYNGDATGIYSQEGGGSVTDAGLFRGNVALTARFGNNTADGDVVGRVHNIAIVQNATGNNVGTTINGYIHLQPAPISVADRGFFYSNTEARMSGSGVFSSVNNIGGKWGGQFYGNDACTNIPGSVAGTFGGRFSSDNYNYTYLGLFGASADSCR